MYVGMYMYVWSVLSQWVATAPFSMHFSKTADQNIKQDTYKWPIKFIQTWQKLMANQKFFFFLKSSVPHLFLPLTQKCKLCYSGLGTQQMRRFLLLLPLLHFSVAWRHEFRPPWGHLGYVTVCCRLVLLLCILTQFLSDQRNVALVVPLISNPSSSSSSSLHRATGEVERGFAAWDGPWLGSGVATMILVVRGRGRGGGEGSGFVAFVAVV